MEFNELQFSEIQVFILGKCKHSCDGCGLKNPDRDIEKVLYNLDRWLKRCQLCGKLNTVTRSIEVAVESAGLITSGEYLITSGYFDKFLNVLSKYGLNMINNLDFSNIITPDNPLIPIVEEVLEKYNAELHIKDPTIHDGSKNVVIPGISPRIQVSSSVLLTGKYLDKSLDGSVARSSAFNYKNADISEFIDSEEFKKGQELFYEFKKRNPDFFLNKYEHVLLIDDSDHGAYFVRHDYESAKFLFAHKLEPKMLYE